jgi:uncharacterized protein (TIGR03492 family)
VKAVLFVSNGHGEAAIAARIARDVEQLSDLRCDHLALVGASASPEPSLHDVGPRKKMPSGGIVAMGNLANLVRDVLAGLGPLTIAQWRFLSRARRDYAAVVAVGDAYALLMAFRARLPVIFVGTAKSVYVAPYGRFEERLLRRAAVAFVRDAATVQRLAAHGVGARDANVMADLGVAMQPERPTATGDPLIAIFPGSRDNAYDQAAFLLRVLASAQNLRPGIRGVLSIAPGLSAGRFASALQRAGLRVVSRDDSLEPFSVYADATELARAWSGEIGAAIEPAQLVLGQAGTANEAAAAAGVPVIAFEGGGWYRHRQVALLGGALRVLPRDEEAGAREVAALVQDDRERERMAHIGRERLGAPGAARRIAAEIVLRCA